MQSEQLNELFTALSKAQSGYAQGEATKKSNYGNFASIEDIWNAIRKPFHENGLTFSQIVDVKEGKIGVFTILGHSSGQWLKSFTPLQDTGKRNNPMQAMGGGITYARRYALAAIVGFTLADNDDDGESLELELAQPSERDQIERYLEMFPNCRNLIMNDLQGDIMNMNTTQYDKYIEFFEKQKQLQQNKRVNNAEI